MINFFKNRLESETADKTIGQNQKLYDRLWADEGCVVQEGLTHLAQTDDA